MDFIQIKLQDFVFDKQLLDGKRRGCMMTITSVQQRYLILKQLNDAVVLWSGSEMIRRVEISLKHKFLCLLSRWWDFVGLAGLLRESWFTGFPGLSASSPACYLSPLIDLSLQYELFIAAGKDKVAFGWMVLLLLWKKNFWHVWWGIKDVVCFRQVIETCSYKSLHVLTSTVNELLFSEFVFWIASLDRVCFLRL